MLNFRGDLDALQEQLAGMGESLVIARLDEQDGRVHIHSREAGAVIEAAFAAGEVDVLRTDDGEAVYRMCSTGHHHHIVCRECGATVEVEGPAVERWADQVSAEHGFTDVSHTLELFGRCGDCG